MRYWDRVFYIFIFTLLVGKVFAGFNFSHQNSTFRVGGPSNAATLYLSRSVTGWDGTLTLSANATISNTTSKTIAFDDGVLNDNGDKSTLSAIYEPGGTYELTLGSGQRMISHAGNVAQSIKIGGPNVKIEGESDFSNAFVFDSNATASFGLKNTLGQNIQFDSSNTNTLYLIDDLRLADDVTIVNNGTIDVNGKEFWFGGKTLTLANSIYWLNAGAINLKEKMILSGTWNIKNETVINGHGNIIDVSDGGVFDIKASTTLHLTDVVLKAVQSGTFVFGDNGSTIRMSNVDIQFHEDITFASGLFYAEGPTSFFMDDNNVAFNSSSNLTVSGMTLWLDGLDEAESGNVTGNLTMVYNGTIKECSCGGDISSVWSFIYSNSDAIVYLDDLVRFIHGPKDFTFSNNLTLSVDVEMTEDHVFTLGGDMVIDGNGHAITFGEESGTIVAGSNNLTFQSVELKDFDPNAISLSTGFLTFGGGTSIELSGNKALTASNYTITCDGYVRLCGHGHELDISSMEWAMDVKSGSTLAICHTRIKGLGGSSGTNYPYNIRPLASDATITFSDCELMLENNFTITQGHYNYYMDNMIGGPENPAGTSMVFAYQSPDNMTIKSMGKLMIDRNVTFSYDSTSASKEKLVMEDATSVFHLNGCTLYSTQTGLQLTGGRLLVEDKVTVQNDARVAAEAMVLKDPLEIDVFSGGVFDLVGGLIEHQ